MKSIFICLAMFFFGAGITRLIAFNSENAITWQGAVFRLGIAGILTIFYFVDFEKAFKKSDKQ